MKYIKIDLIVNKTNFLLWHKSIIEKLKADDSININEIHTVDIQTENFTKKQINNFNIPYIFKRKIQFLHKSKTSLNSLHSDIIPLSLINDEFRYVIPENEIDKFSDSKIFINLTNYHINFKCSSNSDFIILYFLFGTKYNFRYPIGYCEVSNDENIFKISLMEETTHPNKLHILDEYFSKYHRLSYAKSVNLLFMEAYTLLNKYLRNKKLNNDIGLKNKEKILTIKLDSPVSFSINKQIFFYLKIVNYFIKEFIGRVFIGGTWNIGIVKASLEDFVDHKIDVDKINWLENEELLNSKFIADPFGIMFDSELYILYEEVKYLRNRGHIFITKFSNDSKKRRIIKEPFHLSFPYCFNYRNKIYCIPESWENNNILLYEAKEFPYKWEKAKTLIGDIKGVDTSIFRYNNLWWLFTTLKDNGNAYKLFLYYSDNLFGEFISHSMNPVKLDYRSARNGGKIFMYKNEIYRPSIDYSEKHQGAITINRIVSLTKESFEEEIAYTIKPFRETEYNHKLHTFSVVDDYIIFDSMEKKCIFSNLNLILFKIIRLFYYIKNR